MIAGAYSAGGSSGRIVTYHSQGSSGLPTSPTTTLSGGAGDQFGFNLDVADVNGDGFFDLLGAYVMIGKVGIFLSQGSSGLPGSANQNFNYGGLFGYSSSCADWNADGYTDCAISDINNNGSRGAVYIHMGSASGLSNSVQTLTAPPPLLVLFRLLSNFCRQPEPV